MQLEDQLRKVKSRADLARFIEALRDDLSENQDGWENPSLDGFLEAMAAWVGDMDQYFRNKGETLSEDQPWELFATILAAAKTYE